MQLSRIVRIVFVLLVLAVAVAIFLNWSSLRSVTKQEGEAAEVGVDPDQHTTTQPFAEMTIPHLRARQYQSALGDREQLDKKSTYASYLTSYQSDGLKINGLLTIPTGEMPEGGWPAIVFIHGYIPPTIYTTTSRYADFVDYLARNGFVVFKIDLRGHGESEGEASGAYYSSEYVIDALNARAALASSDFVNPASIGLWGHSMAGNVVFRSMAVQPDIPAAVIWAGAVYSYTDWLEYGLNDNSYRPPDPNTTNQRQRRRQELFDTHGQFAVDSAFWQQVAATNYANDIHGAIQIHHAVDDLVVNIGYSRDLMKLLDGTQVPHELFEYQSGGHNLSGGSFNTAMQRTVDFYKEHL